MYANLWYVYLWYVYLWYVYLWCVYLLEYAIYTRDLDDLPALIIRIFEIGGLFYLLVIFKVILEE